MSYSSCLECKKMVYAYEKYCSKCEKTKRENPPDFWKRNDYSFYEEPKRSQEIAKDTLDVSEQKQKVFDHHEMISRGANPNGNRAERRRNAALLRNQK